MNKVLRKKKLHSDQELQLIQGDITLAKVEGIVNPANRMLNHGGGLAGLLSRKAGPDLQKESNAWIKENGPVSHQRPASTGAGNLPFRFIIHAVGPVWGSGDEQTKLNDAVKGSLMVADELGLRSLALPAISTGIFGYPLDKASAVILNAIIEITPEYSFNDLKMIQVVLFDTETANIFQDTWDRSIA
jgi:O-acetyl-ADP-ribose deacetylase (regulator of RNase III)